MLVLEYKIKAKPYQETKINEAIRTVQFVRNKCLRYWIDAHKDSKLNGFDLNKYSTELRQEFPFVAVLNSMAVQASSERAWLAIKRFFDNCKKQVKGKKGYPQFQKDNRSVEYKTCGWKLHPTKRRITFTDQIGIGEVKLLGKWDIHTFPLKSIKRVRIVRRADGYYCQFCVDVDNHNSLPSTGNQIGIDVGQKVFYADSDGKFEDNPRFLKNSFKRVKLYQRRVSQKTKGSSNRIKARKHLAKTHLRVSRQREEFAKRIALRLCQSNDLIAHEDLNVKGLARGRNAKSVNDVAWGLFFQWLHYFGDKYGRQVVAVNPYNTSQMCSNCEEIVSKTLKERIHICQCGLVLDRDINAAINILKLALKMLNISTQGRWECKAYGDGSSTLLGENLVEQVLSGK
jgi:putative transposase